ncbi:MAG: MFS transporter, partial [Brachybacterium tyrofermentans]
GVYNETRQIGSVLGSAAIATLMNNRIAERIAETMGDAGAQAPAAGEGSMSADLPEILHAPFASAMADAMLLPVLLSLVGVLAAFFIGKPVDTGAWEKDA